MDPMKTERKTGRRTKSGSASAAVTSSSDWLDDLTETVCRYGADGQILEVNDVFCRIFGKDREEVIGRNWGGCVVEEDIPSVRKRLRALSPAEPVQVVENRVQTARRRVRWMRFIHRGIFDKSGKLLETRCVGHDITEQRKAEEALRESNERWMFAIEGAGDGVWDWLVEEGKVTYSRAWKEMLGYSVDEIPDRFEEWLSRLHPEDEESALRVVEEHFASDEHSYVNRFRMRCKDGSYRWILARGKIVAWTAEGKPARLIGTHTDITDLKEAKEREARNLRMVAAGAPLAEVLATIVQSVEAEHRRMAGAVMVMQPDGGILRRVASPSLPKAMMERLSELPVGPGIACSGQAVASGSRVVSADLASDPNWAAWRDVVLAEGFQACWAEPIQGNDGRLLGTFACYYREATSPTAEEIDTVRDAAALAALALERQTNGEKLVSETAYTQALLAHTSAYIGALDLRGRFTMINPAFLQGMGFSKEEVIGRTVWDLGMMTEEEDERSRERFMRLLSGEILQPMELKLRDRSGKWHTVEIRSSLTRRADGAPDRIIITATDFTERNELQQAVLNVVEQEQARLGHDLHDGVGQTMTGVIALMNALQEKLPVGVREEAGRVAELLQQSVAEVRRMSHGLSPMSIAHRGLAGGLELLADTARLNFRTPCQCKVDPEIHVTDTKVENHLYRICQEAVNNALRHGKPSQINISLRPINGATGILEVIDNGRGFDPARHGGSGIGLSVMRYRAGLISGEMKIESSRGKGARVACVFPREPAPTAATPVKKARVKPSGKSRK
jgi:PAS domain S-box-containing protein